MYFKIVLCIGVLYATSQRESESAWVSVSRQTVSTTGSTGSDHVWGGCDMHRVEGGADGAAAVIAIVGKGACHRGTALAAMANGAVKHHGSDGGAGCWTGFKARV